MKIKNTAALMKKSMKVELYTSPQMGAQYIGGCGAVYLVPGNLQLDSDNILTVFDIPENKQDSWIVNECWLPNRFCVEDNIEDEKQAKKYILDFVYYNEVLRAYYTDTDMVIINTKYFSPLADILDDISVFIRHDQDGEPYIAVKKGMFLEAVIFPEILEEKMEPILTAVERGCRKNIERRAAGQAKIDIKTGEVIE